MGNFNWGSLLGGLTGGISNIISTSIANKKSEELANTAHQREMADLEAAGINPLMTAVSGSTGASTPNIQAANVGDIVANIPQQMADINKKSAETENTITETEWNRASYEERLEIVTKQLEGMELGNEETRQHIINMMVEERATEQSILHSEAQTRLADAQTDRERAEAVRLARASELITEQVKTEALKQGLTQEQINVALQQIAQSEEQTELITQQIQREVANTRYDEIAADWLRRQNIQDMTGGILDMVLKTAGTILGHSTGTVVNVRN
jgi:chromosome segregation ATPase